MRMCMRVDRRLRFRHPQSMVLKGGIGKCFDEGGTKSVWSRVNRVSKKVEQKWIIRMEAVERTGSVIKNEVRRLGSLKNEARSQSVY